MIRLDMPLAEALAADLPDLADAARDIADLAQGYLDHEPAAIGTVEERREHLALTFDEQIGGLLAALQRTKHALRDADAPPTLTVPMRQMVDSLTTLADCGKVIEALRITLDVLGAIAGGETSESHRGMLPDSHAADALNRVMAILPE